MRSRRLRYRFLVVLLLFVATPTAMELAERVLQSVGVAQSDCGGQADTDRGGHEEHGHKDRLMSCGCHHVAVIEVATAVPALRPTAAVRPPFAIAHAGRALDAPPLPPPIG